MSAPRQILISKTINFDNGFFVNTEIQNDETCKNFNNYCDSKCLHSTNNCSMGLINKLINAKRFSFIEQHSNPNEHYFVSLSTNNTNVPISVLFFKPRVCHVRMNHVLWSLLNPRKYYEQIKYDKIVFFIKLLDDYGEYINIFEKFFDRPRGPGGPGGPGGLFNKEERIAFIEKHEKYIQDARLRQENYKTIVDFANKYLNKNDKQKNDILIALQKRLVEISQFRINMMSILSSLFVTGVDRIIFSFTFVDDT